MKLLCVDQLAAGRQHERERIAELGETIPRARAGESLLAEGESYGNGKQNLPRKLVAPPRSLGQSSVQISALPHERQQSGVIARAGTVVLNAD
jgi:hypothetical protein